MKNKVGKFKFAARAAAVMAALFVCVFAAGCGTVSKTAEADVNVEKIEGLAEAVSAGEFYLGADISSVVSEFYSGVVYYDTKGNAVDNVESFCALMADSGVTCIRVRVWNDPYDSEGNGYGGGDCDVQTAALIASACRDAGIKMLVDFHYSDFWADPDKQAAPKAWADMDLDEKSEALYDFTLKALEEIDPEKNVISMVQLGNETNSALCGEAGPPHMCKLFSSGSAAVREYNPDVKIVIHVTNPESNYMTTWASKLKQYEVDYDILATSYYPYWHGTLEHLSELLKEVKETYGVDVMVAETSFAYTLDDTDGHSNTVGRGGNDSLTTTKDYAFTEQGQASFLHDLTEAVFDAGGVGVFYWEPAWITVGDTTGLEGSEYAAVYAENSEKWEEYGSGWAASYASEYDPKDAGKYYGGSAVDNQAFFYPGGTPTAVLNIFSYVQTGAETDKVSLETIASFEETILIGGAYELPDTVTVTYNNGEVPESVSWDTSSVDVNTAGRYNIEGTVALSQEVTYGSYEGATSVETYFILTVEEPNYIDDKDDAGFETLDNWSLSSSVLGLSSAQNGNVLAGNDSLHWWSSSEALTATATYKKDITLEPGDYTLDALAMGYAGETVTLKVLDAASGDVIAASDPCVLSGWTSDKYAWETPSVSFALNSETTVKVQIELGIQAAGWGSLDSISLH